MSQLYQQGIPTGLFLHKPSDSFTCSICLEILNDPVQCKEGHVYCRCCITEALSRSRRCPECRGDLTLETLGNNLLIKGLINDLQVKCKTNMDQRENVCDWTGKLENLETHLKYTCREAIVSCEYENCEHKVVRKNLNSHLLTCQHRSIPCEHCNESTLWCSMVNHIENCPMRPVDCQNGCGYVIAFKDLGIHNNSCDYRPVRCPLTDMGIKCDCNGTYPYIQIRHHVSDPSNLFKAFSLLSSKIQQLTQVENNLQYLLNENSGCRHRLDELTNQNWEIKDENKKLQTQIKRLESSFCRYEVRDYLN